MNVVGADERSAAADRLREMVDAGAVEMTAGQLLAMFGVEDTDEARQEVADDLYEVGLSCRPPLDRVMPGDKVKVVPSDTPEGDHMLRNGIIWAILLPIVGFVQAIRLFARERVGQGIAVLCVCIVTVLAWLYVAGVFDKPLSSVGLNFHECAKNGLGQTFCGKELDEARTRARHLQEEANTEKENLERENHEREAKLEQQQRRSQEQLEANERREQETQAKLERESAAEQARIQQELSQEGG